MTPEFEARLKQAVDDGILPAAVVCAQDKSGKINYSLSYGPTSLKKPDAPPISPTTLLTMASMTKLVTSICLLRLVEQNILEINEDVTSYLPVLAAQPILTGFDADGQPTLKPRTKPITLRHLLAHSVGAGYILMDDRLAKWAKATGRPLPIPLRASPASGGMSVDSRFNYPLLFEPGEGWVYGSGLDWAGKLVEKLTGAYFDDFMYENVLKPVGVPRGGITFHPGKYNEKPVDHFAGMALRSAETGKVGFMETEVDPNNEGFGGEGLYGGMGEYMKVLHSILMDDGKLLKPEIAKLLFEPLLEPVEKKALNENMENPEWAVGWIPKGVEYDWSVGGLLSTGGELGKRKKGFLQWGGAWNTAWFIDRESGVCGVFGTQVFPPGDAQVRSYTKEFEEAIYSKL